MPVLAAFAVPHPPLIVPAVGHGREREIDATIEAYREVGRRIVELDPDTIVVSSPHTAYYLDYLHIAPGREATGSFASFGAPGEGSTVRYDAEFASELSQSAEAEGIPAGTSGQREPSLDWGILVPLHFVQRAHDGLEPQGNNSRRALPQLPYRIVRLGIAGLSPDANYRFGTLVRKVSEQLGRRIVYVASGDLSHKLSESGPYGYAPEGPEFDKLACRAFRTGDFLELLRADPGLCERAAECGLRSFQIMAGALDRTPVKPELLSYEGPFGVGYGVAAFTPTGLAGSDNSRAFGEQYVAWHKADQERRRSAESPWVRLARFSLERYVRDRKQTDPTGDLPSDLAATLPAELFSTRAGAFVSLKINGQLRGCIGTIAPVRASLAAEICANAVSAGCHDPRFPAVSADELDELVYDVDVLSQPERVQGPENLDAKRYGVIVSTADGRRGLLLPDLDGVDTVEEQLGIAARKGGIDLEEDDVTLERFTVTRHL